MKNRLFICGTALAIAALGGCTSSSTSSSTSAARSAPSPSFTCPAGMSPDVNGVCQPGGSAPPLDTSSAASPTDSSLTGPVGTAFTVTSSDGTSYDVTLDQVSQHVTLGQYDSLTNYRDHAAAAEFTITGDAGSSSDDAFSDANAIGSDQVQYTSSFITSTLPEFSSGEFRVSPGQTVKGWVTFELPPGATVAQVQWAAGFGNPAATWTVAT